MINNKMISYFLITFQTIFCTLFSLSSQPDLSIVGYVITEGGIGKIPITILETLDYDISANIIPTNTPSIKESLSDRTIAALNDKTPGKVAILTEPLAYCSKNSSEHIPRESLIRIAYSMLETDHIHAEWVEILNNQFDAVVVPDQYLVRVYENSGVNIPIFSLPIPMILSSYYNHTLHSRYSLPLVFEEELKHKHPNIFLKAIAKLFKRSPSKNFDLAQPFYSKHGSKPFIFGDTSANKNPEILVTAFARAFGNHPDVQLVMRATYLFPKTVSIVNRLVEQFHLKNVRLEEGPLLLDQYIDKLASFDCYVNLSRGEGFSFIQREALALGVPVITTNNTALSTICNSGCVREVSSDLLGPPNSIYQAIFGNCDVGHQFDCTVEDAMIAFLDVYNNYGKYIDKARQGRNWVRQYDSANKELRHSYRTLIKPTKVILGDKNEISDGTLSTNSFELYQKYQQLNQSDKQNKQEYSYTNSLNIPLVQKSKNDSCYEYNAFNLAQSYHNLGHFDEAMRWYKICTQKGEQKDEVWYSKFMIGEIYEKMGLWNQALEWYLEAYQYNANRAEPLQKIATHYRLHGQNQLAYLFAKQGSLIPYPQSSTLFLSSSVYHYQFDDELSITAYYTPYKEEGFEAINRLILRRNIPRLIKNQAFKNSLFYADNIKINDLKILNVEPKQKNTRNKTIIKYNPFYDFSHFKQSVPPLEFDNGYLLLVNEIIYHSKQRHDLHRFLYLDKDFSVKQISKPFVFLYKGKEQCLEIALDEAEKVCKIILNSKDQKTYLLSIDFKTIHSLLTPLQPLIPPPVLTPPALTPLDKVDCHLKYLTDRIPVSNPRYSTMKLALEFMNERKPTTIIETGTSRYGSANFIGDGGFTLICGDWVKDHQATLCSVDINPEAIKAAKAAIGYNPHVILACQDSIEFLRTFPSNIDFLYIDSYDFDYHNPQPSQEHHLKEIQAAYPKLTSKSVIMIDDCRLPHGGKGALVIPYLQNLGWKIIANEYQVILVKE